MPNELLYPENDVNIDFYSTSLVNFNVHFYGGSPGPKTSAIKGVNSTFEFKMFGSETSFQLIPVDEQCQYKPIFTLDPGTSSTNANKVPSIHPECPKRGKTHLLPSVFGIISSTTADSI